MMLEFGELARSFFCLWLFVVSCSCFELNWDKEAIIKYSQGKILSSCLGESFVRSWEESMRASTEKCYQESPRGDLPSLNSILSDILQKNSFKTRRKDPTPQQQPSSLLYNLLPPPQQNDQPLFDYSQHLPIHYQHQQQVPTQFQHTPQHSQHPFYMYMKPQYFGSPASVLGGHHPHTSGLGGHRLHTSKLTGKSEKRIWKRSTADLPQEPKEQKRSGKNVELHPAWREVQEDTLQLLRTVPKVNVVRRQLGDRVSNITCVLRSMELIDDAGLPNYSYNSRLIEALNVDESLRVSFREVQDFCREFSMCVPVHRMSNILVREVGYSLVFMKCLKEKILQACISHDMEMSSGGAFDFDLEELVRTSNPFESRATYATRSGGKLFDETPLGVRKDLVKMFSADDDIAFGF